MNPDEKKRLAEERRNSTEFKRQMEFDFIVKEMENHFKKSYSVIERTSIAVVLGMYFDKGLSRDSLLKLIQLCCH